MNILLVTNSYPPEIRSISFMMKELSEGLVLRGHQVTVATYWPKDNLTEEATKTVYQACSLEDGVQVLRVKTPPLRGVNFIVRGISELLSPFLFWREIKAKMAFTPDAVIVYISPLPLAFVGSKVKGYYGARYLLNIQDIFPQNAIDLGIMKNTLPILFFEYLEKRAYAKADKITSHTESSRRFLIERKHVPSSKISTVPNWIDFELYSNRERSHIFRKRYGLEGKFIVLFPGIMGPSQGLTLIVDMARELRDIDDIVFLFVGDGSEKETLRKSAERYGLKNVVFMPFVSPEEYPDLVKDSDAGLVCLSSKNRTPVIPGKILGFMAASIPVVAFLNRESDGHALIRDAQCGYASVSDISAAEAKDIIFRMYVEKDKLKQYGENGHRYAYLHFSKDRCIDNLLKLVQEKESGK
jgi:colanic acid biosynthesis glycosyl transferase WcaI